MPAGLGEDDEDQKWRRRDVERAIRDSLEEDSGKTAWPGAELELDPDRPEPVVGNVTGVAGPPTAAELGEWLLEQVQITKEWCSEFEADEGLVAFDAVMNVFCPTGPGGGVKPDCPAGGAEDREKELAEIDERRTGVRERIAAKQEAAEYTKVVREKVLKAEIRVRKQTTKQEKIKQRLVELTEKHNEAFQHYLARSKEIQADQDAGKITAVDADKQLSEVERSLTEVHDEFVKTHDQRVDLDAKVREAALRAIEVPKEERYSKENFSGHIRPFRGGEFGDVRSSEVKEQIGKGAEFVHSRLSSSIQVPKLNTDYEAWPKGTRASHFGVHNVDQQESLSTLRIAADSTAATVVHEWGHALEHQDPRIGRAAKAFLDKRVKDEPPVPLNSVVSHGGYEPDERGRSDGFVEAFGKDRAYYVGKDYGGRATEIMSMGMEQLYRDPVHFAKSDPEYFEFVVGVLHGRIRG